MVEELRDSGDLKTYPSIADRRLAHPHSRGDVRSFGDRQSNEGKPDTWH